MNSSAGTHPATSSSEERTTLVGRLDASRRAVIRVRTGIVICLACASFLVLCGGMAVVDYFAELPWGVRALWLGMAGLAGAILAGWAWWSWAQGFTLREAAKAVEGGCRRLGQRFRTFVDYEDADAHTAQASPGLVAALTRETSALATCTDFENVSRTQPLGKTLAATAGVLAIWGVWLAAGPEFRIAAARTFLATTEYTEVTFTPIETAIMAGGDVEIQVEIKGRPIRAGELRIEPRGKTATPTVIDLHHLSGGSETASDVVLTPVSDVRRDAASEADSKGDRPNRVPLSGVYRHTLRECRESLDFQVVAGPRALPTGSIRVIEPLRIERFTAHIQPPTYTGLPASDVTTPQFRVQEGSRIDFEVHLNRLAADFRVDRLSEAVADPSMPSADPIDVTIDERRLIGRISDLRQELVVYLHAGSLDGMRIEPLRLHIRVQPDAKPTVRFVQPAEELEVLATAEIPMQVEAGDDLGLHKVGIGYQIGHGSMQPLWEHDYAGQTDRVHSAELLALEQHQVSFPESVNYFAFAEDNYFGEPRRVVTPLRFVDIRPFKRAYQMLDNGGT